MEIKDIIKARRLELGKTLEDIGKEVGVSKSTVMRWENGDIDDMRRSKVVALAKALNTTPAYLMGWENEKGYTSNKARLIAEIENMSEEQAALLLAAFQAAKASK